MLDMTPGEKRGPSFEEIYAAIERLPEGTTGEILVPGVLHTMPRAAPLHQFTLQEIGHELRGRFDPRAADRGWWLLLEVEVRLPGGRLAVPDLSGWRKERVPALPTDNPIAVVPDFCLEVLSPTTAATDRALKLGLYARCGVGHVWLVDPALRLVEVYETARERPTLVATARDDESAELPPFEHTFAVGGWWHEGQGGTT